jgi:hypothetical protein
MDDFISVLFVSEPWNSFGIPDLESYALWLSEDSSTKFGVGVVADVTTLIKESLLRIMSVKGKVAVATSVSDG